MDPVTGAGVGLTVSKSLEEHERNYRHEEIEKLMGQVGDLHTRQEMIADVVLGEPHENYDGEIERRGGLKEMAKQSQNGGLRVKIPAVVWVAIVTQTGLLLTTLIVVAN